MLHWANKDQYYTKSGESFSNYAFTLENGKKVQFRLVEADTAKDNRKDNNQVRVFALIEPRIKTETDENGDEIQTDILPFDIQGDLLTLRFEYIAINGTEKQRTKLQKEYILQAVDKIKTFAISDDFQEIFTLKPTDTNKTRTLLEKYLTDYTAKNTADYFIHKNLCKFLNQELDFYIKNEVMNLDNIQDSTNFSHIEQNLQTIKTLKIVAKEIIAFLAQLEDFQKKLWLKKKFVAGCHYLITLDHLNEAQVQTALENPKQTAQWQALFHVNTSGLNAAELCKSYPHLVMDTALFEPTFQADVLNHLQDLDDKTNGLLIHSDNFQALNLLQERYKEQVKCIYIDPPYNTEKDREEGKFIYKDSFVHSSWISLLDNRMEVSYPLLKNEGVFFASIDNNEIANLDNLFRNYFNEKNFEGLISWRRRHNQPNDKNKMLGLVSEYILVYAKSKEMLKASGVGKLELTGNFSNPDNDPKGVWGSKPWKAGSDQSGSRYEIVSPTGKVFNEEWLGDKDTFEDYLTEGRMYFPNNGNGLPRKKYYKFEREEEGQCATNWWGHEQFGHNQGANDILTALMGEKNRFSNPKPTELVKGILNVSSKQNDFLILDYFAGSGTTAHAVINLNREDNGNRKYILVEQGEYFDSVLKPRVQKVIFAKEWKDGKPQADNGVFGGVSQIVKVLKLESYEDTLNNLELRKPIQDLADMGLSETVQNDYLLHYMLDVESRDSLLNTQHFTKPFDYKLNIATTSAGAYEAKTIDLVETFNYLIGLRVRAIDDQREKRGWVTVKGKLANDDNALIIWRDCEKIGYGELNDFIRKNAYGVEDKAEYSEETFKVVYINGDHNVPTVFTDSDDSVKTLKVRSIEAEFFSRMFG